MAQKNSSAAEAFMRSTLEELSRPALPASASAAGARIHMLVGSVGRDAIILGDVPPNALELVLGRQGQAG